MLHAGMRRNASACRIDHSSTKLVFPCVPFQFPLVSSTIRVVDGHTEHVQVVLAGLMIDSFVSKSKGFEQLFGVLANQVADRENVDSGEILNEGASDSGYRQEIRFSHSFDLSRCRITFVCRARLVANCSLLATRFQAWKKGGQPRIGLWYIWIWRCGCCIALVFLSPQVDKSCIQLAGV